MKRLFALLLCLTLLPLNVPLVHSDDSDIFGANIEPNIMIFIDSSGSMDDYIDQAATAPYDPATTYPAHLRRSRIRQPRKCTGASPATRSPSARKIRVDTSSTRTPLPTSRAPPRAPP